MKNRRNYYRILHVQPDAPPDIVRSSYRTLMQTLKMHPDLGGDKWNASILNEAYRVLSDPARRAAYDAAFIGNPNGVRAAAQAATHGARRDETPPTADSAAPDPSVCAFCRTPKPQAGYVDQVFCAGCGGPLATITSLHVVGTTTRCFERMPFNAPLTIYLATDDEGRGARLRDLSPAGLQLQTRIPLGYGDVVRIDGTTVSAIGRVTYCNREPGGGYFTAGIAFLTVHFHARAGTFVSGSA